MFSLIEPATNAARSIRNENASSTVGKSIPMTGSQGTRDPRPSNQTFRAYDEE
jgi:hypothetical protein